MCNFDPISPDPMYLHRSIGLQCLNTLTACDSELVSSLIFWAFWARNLQAQQILGKDHRPAHCSLDLEIRSNWHSWHSLIIMKPLYLCVVLCFLPSPTVFPLSTLPLLPAHSNSAKFWFGALFTHRFFSASLYKVNSPFAENHTFL